MNVPSGLGPSNGCDMVRMASMAPGSNNTVPSVLVKLAYANVPSEKFAIIRPCIQTGNVPLGEHAPSGSISRAGAVSPFWKKLLTMTKKSAALHKCKTFTMLTRKVRRKPKFVQTQIYVTWARKVNPKTTQTIREFNRSETI
eukprot:m.62493 g.62493  ORF g.62493 m.62493 type:complete len:142 (-) comp23164_c0_seq1:77-502(-)